MSSQLYFIYNKFSDLVDIVYGPKDIDIYSLFDKFKGMCNYPSLENYDEEGWWNKLFESENKANELGYAGTFEDAFINFLVEHWGFTKARYQAITLDT